MIQRKNKNSKEKHSPKSDDHIINIPIPPSLQNATNNDFKWTMICVAFISLSVIFGAITFIFHFDFNDMHHADNQRQVLSEAPDYALILNGWNEHKGNWHPLTMPSKLYVLPTFDPHMYDLMTIEGQSVEPEEQRGALPIKIRCNFHMLRYVDESLQSLKTIAEQRGIKGDIYEFDLKDLDEAVKAAGNEGVKYGKLYGDNVLIAFKEIDVPMSMGIAPWRLTETGVLIQGQDPNFVLAVSRSPWSNQHENGHQLQLVEKSKVNALKSYWKFKWITDGSLGNQNVYSIIDGKKVFIVVPPMSWSESVAYNNQYVPNKMEAVFEEKYNELTKYSTDTFKAWYGDKFHVESTDSGSAKLSIFPIDNGEHSDLQCVPISNTNDHTKPKINIECRKLATSSEPPPLPITTAVEPESEIIFILIPDRGKSDRSLQQKNKISLDENNRVKDPSTGDVLHDIPYLSLRYVAKDWKTIFKVREFQFLYTTQNQADGVSKTGTIYTLDLNQANQQSTQWKLEVVDLINQQVLYAKSTRSHEYVATGNVEIPGHLLEEVSTYENNVVYDHQGNPVDENWRNPDQHEADLYQTGHGGGHSGYDDLMKMKAAAPILPSHTDPTSMEPGLDLHSKLTERVIVGTSASPDYGPDASQTVLALRTHTNSQGEYQLDVIINDQDFLNHGPNHQIQRYYPVWSDVGGQGNQKIYTEIAGNKKIFVCIEIMNQPIQWNQHEFYGILHAIPEEQVINVNSRPNWHCDKFSNSRRYGGFTHLGYIQTEGYPDSRSMAYFATSDGQMMGPAYDGKAYCVKLPTADAKHNRHFHSAEITNPYSLPSVDIAANEKSDKSLLSAMLASSGWNSSDLPSGWKLHPDPYHSDYAIKPDGTEEYIGSGGVTDSKDIYHTGHGDGGD